MEARMEGTAVAGGLFEVEELGERLWRIGDALGDLCYLVEGEREAALVDTLAGLGDVVSLARGLVGEKKQLRVLLTHCHPDHVGGAYFARECWVGSACAGAWNACERQGLELVAGMADEAGVPFGPRDGVRPVVRRVAEGTSFDLGGRTLAAVELPGHTADSVGYLCPELGILFSGDAVTPIMCLCFPESLGLDGWLATLHKMEKLSFERFWTGHHRHDFTNADLVSFEEVAAFARTDRGHSWHHMLVSDWEGTLHLCPCPTSDPDSCDFRAVITRGLPPVCTRQARRVRT